jgi:eukaryotic-like serine/threonine-protein kinase
LSALATEAPDTPRRAGPLRPVLLGLLRRNPRHRMRAPEAERLLRRIAAGEGGRGGGARRSRLLSRRSIEVGAVAAEGSGPVAAVLGASAPASTSSALATVDRPPAMAETRVTTAAEDTYRYHPVRHHRVRWVVATTGLLAVVLAGAVVWYVTHPPTAAPLPSTVEAAPLSEGMGVQACVAQAAERESPVPDGGPPRPGEFGLLAGWTYFRDPTGYRIAVPQAWRMSRIGTLQCFRDPSSPRAIAVLDQGRRDGDPAELLADGERTWRDEARLTDYRRLGIANAHYDEGAADLEYTYRVDGMALHGTNRMLRIDGRLFTLYWLTTDFSWSSDQALLDFLRPSFDVS